MKSNRAKRVPPQVTKEILFRLIDEMVSASAHGSSVIRSPGEAWLNPQPLPPGGSETPAPEPWRSAAVARQIISLAAVFQAGAATEPAGVRSARSVLRAFVDDSCGLGSSRRLPLPPPWPRSGVRPNPLGLLVAAAQFHAVAKTLTGSPIADALEEGADRLLAVGLQRLAG